MDVALAVDKQDVEYAKASDEHGVLQISGVTRFKVGDKLKLIPAMGVYAVLVRVDETGLCYKGMMNIGKNPTTDTDDSLKIEVNLFDMQADLYNKELTVDVIEYLRPELKFNGLQELIQAIDQDKISAQAVLKNYK